jgi:hypothetical protein
MPGGAIHVPYFGEDRMITKQDRMEDLSAAYVRAVVARAGLLFTKFERDCGVDGFISNARITRNRKRRHSGPQLQVQLKSTTRWSLKNNSIIYDLEVKTYNDLVYDKNASYLTSLYLVLFCMPAEEGQWCSVDSEALVLRHCCYWWQPGEDDQESEAARTKRIAVPTAQAFTPEEVTRLVTALSC